VRLGREIGGRGETDAVFEVRKKEVQFESVSADETTGVFGVGEIKTIRSRVHGHNDQCLAALISVATERSFQPRLRSQ
jgi:hypothetical protein